MRIKTLEEYIEMLRKEDLLVSSEGIDTGALAGAGSEVQIKDVSYNSILCGEGTLFICKGANFKEQYLKDALENGAVAYVCTPDFAEKEQLSSVPRIVVSDMRKAISRISALYFDRSWDKGLKLVGLTGTKGKSTTATMLKSILDIHRGREIGFSSGIYTYDGEHREKARKLTTPETIELHRILDGCVRNDCRYLVMEVSSQALKYDRTLDLNFEVCGFLNISEDHISAAEHKDMEDYFTSKLKIFRQSRIACINADMDPAYLGRVLAEAQSVCEKVVTFGFGHNAHVRGLNVEEVPGKIIIEAAFDADGKTCRERFTVNIGGAYNASNALMAIAAALELGVPVDTIRQGLEQVKVAGRMELYTIPKKSVDIIVDCAHNKMSYEALFDYVHHHYPDRKVGFLFGCVGDKAFNRRKEAGEIADKNADFIVITERDPGKEDVNKICNEILENIEHKEKARIITDRDRAVRTALETAEELGNCVVILAGCGSDAYVKRGTSFVEFATDGERVQEYLQGR